MANRTEGWKILGDAIPLRGMPTEILLAKQGRNRFERGTEAVFDRLALNLIAAEHGDGGQFLIDEAERGRMTASGRLEVRDGDLWAVEIDWRAGRHNFLTPRFRVHAETGRICCVEAIVSAQPLEGRGAPLGSQLR